MSPSHYELLLLLGQADGARLWLARETNVGLSRLVRVKEVDQGAVDQHALATWLEIARDLRHPTLNPITDTEEEPDGRRFIVEEWLRGEPLTWVLRQLRDEAVTPDHALALHITAELAAALQAGLDAPRPWRPALLSPEHVILSYEGTVRLGETDGLHIPLSPEALGLQDPPDTWAAPEVRAGHPGDPRSDVYTLGALLSELLTARPFQGWDDAAARRAVAAGAPGLAAALLARALAHHPDERFQDPGQLHRSLTAALAQSGRDASPQALSAFMARAFPRRLRHWRAIRDAEFRDDDAAIAERVAVLCGVAPPTPEAPPQRGASFEPNTPSADPVWEPPTQQLTFDEALMRQRLAALTDDNTGLHLHPALAATPRIHEPPPPTVDLHLPGDIFTQLDAFLQRELPPEDASAEVHGDTLVSGAPAALLTTAPRPAPEPEPEPEPEPDLEPTPPPQPAHTERPFELRHSIEPRADDTLPANDLHLLSATLPPPAAAPAPRRRAGRWLLLLGVIVTLGAASAVALFYWEHLRAWIDG